MVVRPRGPAPRQSSFRHDRDAVGAAAVAVVERLEERQLMAAAPPITPRAVWPTVTKIAVDGPTVTRTGTPTIRSRVQTVAVTFDRDLSGGIDAGDLTIRSLTSARTFAGTDLPFAYNPATLTATWSFAGAANTVGASLIDGRYVAVLSAAGVSVGQAADLDGDANGVAGGNLAFAFGRMFGDVDSTGTVTDTDKAALTATMGSALGSTKFDRRFDFDNNGLINAADKSAFDSRYGKTLGAAKPLVPTGLTAVALSGSQVQLGWAAGPLDTTSTRVERATASAGPWTAVATLPAGTTGRKDTGLTAGKKYYYRLVAVSPFGNSAATAAVAVTASASPKLNVFAPSLNFADAVDGLVSAPQTVKVTNNGTGGLVIQSSGVTFTGADAALFSVGTSSFPLLLAPGQSATLRVRMNAASSDGIATATLRIVSNDPTVRELPVRGVGYAAGTRGPTVQQILDFNGVPMTAPPNANPLVAATTGAERAMPVLVKAGPGPVTVEPLGMAAAGNTTAELMKLGWYATGPAGGSAAGVKTPLFTIDNADAAAVHPATADAVTFDPGGDAFGLFADWPGGNNRRTYTEDALNAFEPNAHERRKVRFFPLRAADGSVVPDAYLVTARFDTNTSLTRQATMIVRNVRHASLPSGWQSRDVGPAAVAGQAVVSAGSFAVAGGGAGMGTDADALHLAHRNLTGDGEVIARATAVGGGSGAAGVTLRSSSAADAAHVSLERTAAGDVVFRARSAAGASAEVPSVADPAAGGPVWLRLVRAGDLVTGYWSVDGVEWVQQGSISASLGAVALAGLTASGYDDAVLATVSFDKVKVVNGTDNAPSRVTAPATAAGVVTVAAVAGDAATSGRLLVDGKYVGDPVAGDGPYAFRWDSRTVGDGFHFVAVETTNAAGAATRVEVLVEVANPDAAPAVWFPTLAQGESLSGVARIEAAATDERGVADVTFKLDGVTVGVATAAPYAFNFNTTAYADGWRTLTAVARDTSGKLTTSRQVRVRISNVSAPTALEVQAIKIEARRNETKPWTAWEGEVLAEGLRLPGWIAPRSQYGGDASRTFGATGYFRAQKVNGRWWMVDPEGRPYFDNGVVAVNENVFANNRAAYEARFGTGAAATAKWAAYVRGWLNDLGMYTAAWTTQTAQRTSSTPMNYTLVLQLMSDFAKQVGQATAGNGNNSYPNGAMPVFDPRFAEYCNNYFATVFPTRYPGLNPQTDPYLVGYMTDNELPWGTSTLDSYLLLQPGDPNRAAAEAWVRARGVTTPTDADRADFLSYVADTYFKVTSRAIKAYDPNHLNLGARFVATDGKKAYLWKAAKPYVQVVTVNYYDDLKPAASLQTAATAADLPFVVSEFYAKGVDSGLANRAGFGLTVRTQADRGAYYQSVVLSLLKSPNAVGLSWLSLMDNNESNGFADPTNTDSNKGLMPITYPLTQADNPYAALTGRIKDLNANLYELIRRFGP